MRKKLVPVLAVLFMALVSVAFSATFALPTGSAHWSNKEFVTGKFSVQLTVEDGTSRIVAVVIPVDIALDEIDTLEFQKMVSEGYCGWSTQYAGWNPNILLGIDLDGDGKYKAKDFEWQFSADVGYTPELLRGDTFIQGEGAGLTGHDEDFALVDAYDDYAWYTPDTDGVGYFGYYGSLSGFQTGNGVAGIPTDARVKVIKILIGGSTSWMAEVAFVDRLVLNGDPILDEPSNSKAAFEIVTRD